MPIQTQIKTHGPDVLRAGLLTSVAMLVAGCGDAPLGPLVLSELATPAGDFSGQAHLAAAPDGAAVLSWLEPTTGDGMALKLTTLASGVETWTEPRSIAEGENWFINWADFPSVVPISESLWVAHWLVYREDYDGYDSVVAISTDAGATWSEPTLLNTDGTPTEHG
ncbi:MAG TPA: sialidase family protein, partial [Gammaproteobacteria bacterium]|nr:sialidase family protein [Gammaproteobacteria bacterium]